MGGHDHGHDHDHDHGHGQGGHGEGDAATTGVHGMLAFGDEQAHYLSHLPMFGPPHNFHVVLEVAVDDKAAKAWAEDRSSDPPADLYTFVPAAFSITDLVASDGEGEPLRSIEGTLVRGHFERGGTPLATDVEVDVKSVVHFAELDVAAEASDSKELAYLCFGRAGSLYMAHEIEARPSFDHVVAVRLVAGTVADQAGRALEDDVAEMAFGRAQPVQFSRPDTPATRLQVGEVASGRFFQATSKDGRHGFTVDVSVEREVYFEEDELA